jgi:hypothetical protein
MSFIIQGKHVRSLDRHFAGVKPGIAIVLGVRDLASRQSRLAEIGFTPQLAEGESVLPPGCLGPTCERNANGSYIIHKNRPKETAYRVQLWHWTEWRGRYDKVEKSKLVNVPYKRWPRTFVPPPSVEVAIATTTKGEKLVVLDPITFEPAKPDALLHCVNLMLELFGECEILTAKLDQIIRGPVRRLNWDVLPQGQLPWPTLRPLLAPLIAKAPQGNQPVITDRLETISKYTPAFVAVGRSGFAGYVIFGFPKKKVFVLESAETGNATYVFGQNWQQLSQMTKAQILAVNLQKDRIVHLVGWHDKIKALLK